MIDHLIAIKALQRRKAEGRGVFLIAADRESTLSTPARLQAAARRFSRLAV
ncbi:hypothetical protein ACTMU2_13890 [Cupriavidus basilensis]